MFIPGIPLIHPRGDICEHPLTADVTTRNCAKGFFPVISRNIFGR